LAGSGCLNKKSPAEKVNFMAGIAADNVGLYLVSGVAGKEGTPGAPLLHFHLVVNAVTGAITGQAVQTQAIAPPGDKIYISNVKGMLHHTGIAPYTQVVSLEGSTVISFPPPAIGSYLAPFDAHFAVDDQWNGIGGWTLGSTTVNNVPVKSLAAKEGKSQTAGS
jgi:hypothetical protein